MNKKFFVLFCLILFVCSVSFASASDNLNQSISEDIGSDDVLVIDAGAGTFSELQEQINNPENESTVNLDKDYLYDEEFGGEGIFINNIIFLQILSNVVNIMTMLLVILQFYVMIMNHRITFGLLMIIFILKIITLLFQPCSPAVMWLVLNLGGINIIFQKVLINLLLFILLIII